MVHWTLRPRGLDPGEQARAVVANGAGRFLWAGRPDSLDISVPKWDRACQQEIGGKPLFCRVFLIMLMCELNDFWGGMEAAHESPPRRGGGMEAEGGTRWARGAA